MQANVLRHKLAATAHVQRERRPRPRRDIAGKRPLGSLVAQGDAHQSATGQSSKAGRGRQCARRSASLLSDRGRLEAERPIAA